MKTKALAISSEINTLIRNIRLEIEKGKERAYLAMEQEKKVTYWNVGKHIKEHLLENEERADYGIHLFTILSKNLGMGSRNLYLCVQFYEEYPKIVQTSAQLTWSHYTTLLTVPEKIRKKYEEKALTKKLSVQALKMYIKEDNACPISLKPQKSPTLSVTRDTPYVYKLEKIQNQLMVDLGFNFFINTKDVSALELKGADIFNKSTHYTYKAYVVEIIDGDTIWANIDLGFNAWTTQKLRFRGINTQPLETPEGKAAKDFLETQLTPCQFIAIKTYWRDKFNRYLVDIFYDKDLADFQVLTQKGEFLNQKLLDENLAIKY